MSKVITFSTQYPSYHPRKGEPTWFVEKIWKFIYDNYPGMNNPLDGYHQVYNEAFPLKFDPLENIHNHHPKSHTIRQGHRWKVGDKFSPRVWSGKPYQSPQITIAPDIEIKKIWNFEVDECGSISSTVIGNKSYHEIIPIIAKNDGLLLEDFEGWFKLNERYKKFLKGKPMQSFEGQIICWNESIEY